jgi:hypothetical protein
MRASIRYPGNFIRLFCYGSIAARRKLELMRSGTLPIRILQLSPAPRLHLVIKDVENFLSRGREWLEFCLLSAKASASELDPDADRENRSKQKPAPPFCAARSEEGRLILGHL